MGNIKKRTRFRMATGSAVVVSFVAILATFKGLTDVAMMSLGILGGVVTYYTKKETERPSNKP